MKKIFTYFIENSFIVNLISGFIIIVGLVCMSLMNRDLIPALQFPSVQVNISLFGGTAEEVEKFVTYPVEDSLKNLVGVKEVTSTSSNSLSSLSIKYNSDYDQMDQSAEMVRSQIDRIRSTLPENIRSINVRRAEIKDTFLYWLGLEGLQQENTLHRQFFKNFKNSLLKIKGVAKTNSDFKDRDIYIKLKPKQLDKHNLSTTRVRNLLRGALVMLPVGEIDNGKDKIEVKLNSTVNNIQDLKKLVLRKNASGFEVKLEDIADVSYKLGTVKTKQMVNGLPGISAGVRKDLNSDSIDLKEKTDKVIKRFNKNSPDNIKISSFLDGPRFILQQIEVLTKNGFIGFIFVLLTLIIFLNFKTAIMTSLGLPLAYFGTLIILYSFGLNIDLLSIIGMILVIGVLVDDAIIVAEKYNELLSSGLPPKEAAQKAVEELIIPVTGTILTTVIAFSPLIFIKSEMSTLLYAVPIVVISALAISWFESFFILPNHLAHFAQKPSLPKADKFMNSVTKKYKDVLHFIIKGRYIAFLVLIGLVGCAGYIASTKIKKNFDFRINPEYITINATLKKSTSLDHSFEQVKDLEKALQQLPKKEVTNVSTQIGSVWTDGKVKNSPRYVQISLFPNRTDNYPQKQMKRITPLVDEIIKKYNQNQFEKIEVSTHQEGNNESKENMVTLYIRGSDQLNFKSLESEVLEATKGLKELKEYSPDTELFQTSWQFNPNVANLSLHKIPPPELAQQIRSYFSADHLIETRMNGESVWVYTELQNKESWIKKDLDQLEIISPQGVSVPAYLLGSWEKKENLKKLIHKNGDRQFSMDFKVAKSSNRAQANKALAAAIEPLTIKFNQYTFDAQYLSDQEQSNQSWALKVAIICMLGVLFVLAIILKSLTQPLIVGLPIPFGVIGIILALYFHNLPMGLMAMVGLVGTIGVSVNSSIIMVDQINRLQKARGGIMNRGILIDACSSRLRAILLTTLTTLLGVFPMAYAFGGESGFTQPLAFSMAWGLSFSTLLTLFVLPALLEIREDILRGGRWLLKKIGLGSKSQNNKFNTRKPLAEKEPQNKKTPEISEDLHPASFPPPPPSSQPPVLQ